LIAKLININLIANKMVGRVIYIKLMDLPTRSAPNSEIPITMTQTIRPETKFDAQPFVWSFESGKPYALAQLADRFCIKNRLKFRKFKISKCEAIPPFSGNDLSKGYGYVITIWHAN